MDNPKSADIHLYQNRDGMWVARVTVIGPGEPYRLPPTTTRYTAPEWFQSLALMAADRLLTEMFRGQ